MLNDLRFALRQLRKSPGFAVAAVLTLALGIGVNTAIFSMVDSILLRPLPFPQQSRLMRIGYGGGESNTSFFPKGWIRALGDHSRSFASISGFGADAESNVGEANSPNRVFGAEVIDNALSTLGVHPALGRFFTPDDARAGHDPVVVLSYGYWKEHFAADPAIIGEPLRIDGISRQIIGVMPAGVRFPYADTQFVTPVTFKGGDPIDPWNDFDLCAFGRLKDGVTPAQAQSELRRLQKLLLPMFPWRMPDSWASETTVVSLLDSIVGNTRPRLLLLFGAVGLVLLVACANVATLMLARAASRLALGAQRWAIVRGIALRGLALAAGGSALGLVAAAALTRLLRRFLFGVAPLDPVTFLSAPALMLLLSVAAAWIPARRAASIDPTEALRSE